jgi:DNA-binding response OmpR family regulator
MSEQPTRVLVVEDDPGVAAGIVRGLRAAGYEVELATNGVVGARRALDGAFSLVVLDLLLPEQNGFAVLEQVRGRSSTPFIVLTARTDLGDRLRCFELGAVDFVSKPFFIEELVARIRSRLGERKVAPKRVVSWEDVAVDLDARVATVAGSAVALTRHEFDILAYLVERAGRAVSRAQLATQVLTPFEERAERTVDSHIVRVRKKLGARGAAHIVTVWGIGYRFEPAKGPGD